MLKYVNIDIARKSGWPRDEDGQLRGPGGAFAPAKKLAEYEGYERDLRRSLREGGFSGEAYPGTLLVLGRGIGEEEGYVSWCDKAADLLLFASPPRADGRGSREDG